MTGVDGMTIVVASVMVVVIVIEISIIDFVVVVDGDGDAAAAATPDDIARAIIFNGREFHVTSSIRHVRPHPDVVDVIDVHH